MDSVTLGVINVCLLGVLWYLKGYKQKYLTLIFI